MTQIEITRVHSDRNAPWSSKLQDRRCWTLAKALRAVQGRTSLALKPPFNSSCASWGVKGRASRVDEVDEPLDAPSCALKLEHGLCKGIACGKGCLSENQKQGRCHCDGAFLSERTLRREAHFWLLIDTMEHASCAYCVCDCIHFSNNHPDHAERRLLRARGSRHFYIQRRTLSFPAAPGGPCQVSWLSGTLRFNGRRHD